MVAKPPSDDPYRTNCDKPCGVVNPFCAEYANKWDAWWLPTKPDEETLPKLHAFWSAMTTGITGWKTMAVLKSGIPLVVGTSRPSQAMTPMDTGRFSHSANWSGATARVSGGAQFTQVAGSWVEPKATRVGPQAANAKREYRSSIWIGLNGHAAYIDAALPQAGTCQQVEWKNGTAAENHWVWFQWWAMGKSPDDNDLRMPEYIDIGLQPGDRVWFYIELQDGVLVPPDPPQVARVTIVIEAPARSGIAASKTLVMPFLMYPPKNAEGRQAEVGGTTANWIIELPRVSKDIKKAGGKRFLMPALKNDKQEVRLQHCVAACADVVGGPLLAERTLEVSRRISLIDVDKDDSREKQIRVMSEEWRDAPETERDKSYEGLTDLIMSVPGNGA